MLEEIENEMAQGAEVFRALAASDPALIVTEGHIQGPMQGVFNAPMTTRGVSCALGIALE